MKDLLRSADLSERDVDLLLELSGRFKANPYMKRTRLLNDTVVLYFNKPSTRTRISFETAIVRLGATPIMVTRDELQLGRGETIEDTARVISRYARAFAIRTFSDADVVRFARASTIPVVNALTDRHHPLQSLADIFTLTELRGPVRGARIAFVGAGNNVAHSLMEMAAILGAHVAVATPPGYEPDPGIAEAARATAARHGGSVTVGHDPVAAARGADAVYTDAWLSMGDPACEQAARVAALIPYQVNAALMRHAKPGAAFMHCLPDHRGEEVTAEVIDGPQSVVFEQAENRLHTTAAVLLALVEGRLEGTGLAR